MRRLERVTDQSDATERKLHRLKELSAEESAKCLHEQTGRNETVALFGLPPLSGMMSDKSKWNRGAFSAFAYVFAWAKAFLIY